jgi:Pre-mRNA splicing factor PRP21 like protein
MIPTSDMNNHIKHELLDPRYKIIKEELESRASGKNLASNLDISYNLQDIKKRRPDIFGQTDVFQSQMEIETQETK